MHAVPDIAGPVPVTEKSHPFCSMDYARVPLKLSEYGYIEEEYFVSGKANIYDCDTNGELFIDGDPLPYKTRILVRKPADRDKFSGRVYMDIMNATQGYDIEDLWHRNYLWCMEHGHGYVGITSKPVNVQSLKNFDYGRYADLNFAGRDRVPMPALSASATLPGTEEGLIWDMIAQTAAALRDGSTMCFYGLRAEYLYLTGQSQSGAYLNTFAGFFDKFANAGGTRLFDGYMNIVGALVERSIRQEPDIGPLKLRLRVRRPIATPYICMSSEADLYLFNNFLKGDLFSVKIEDSDTALDKCRYYEIAGSPHTDILCPVLNALSEVEKTGAKMPNLDEKLVDAINDLPVEFYICGMLEKLHIWAAEGKAPECVEKMERVNGDLKRDRFGNALGGFRSPFLDVPIAAYQAVNPDDPEGICGKMRYFTKEEFDSLYSSKEEYLQKFAAYTEKQKDNHWLDDASAEKMIEWSKKAVERVLGRS